MGVGGEDVLACRHSSSHSRMMALVMDLDPELAGGSVGAVEGSTDNADDDGE